jgi:hypothetical protein
MICTLPSIIRIIKSRRMRWAGHVARMGRRGTHIGLIGHILGCSNVHYNVLKSEPPGPNSS